MFLVAGASLAPGIFFYLITVYNFVYAGKSGDLDSTAMLVLVIVTSAIGFVVTPPIAGALSDKFGGQRVYLWGGLALIVIVAFPLYFALDGGALMVSSPCATLRQRWPSISPGRCRRHTSPPPLTQRSAIAGCPWLLLSAISSAAPLHPLIAGALFAATNASVSTSLYVFVAGTVSITCAVLLGRVIRKKASRAGRRSDATGADEVPRIHVFGVTQSIPLYQTPTKEGTTMSGNDQQFKTFTLERATPTIGGAYVHGLDLREEITPGMPDGTTGSFPRAPSTVSPRSAHHAG